jgi:hypothetical protein
MSGRFLCSISWEKKFPHCVSKSLSRYQLDNNAIILFTNSTSQINNNQLNLTLIGSLMRGSKDLTISWWQAQKLDPRNIGNSWKSKIQTLKRKFRGWNINTKSKHKKKKKRIT